MNTTQQTKAKATFEVTTWDEKPYLELEGGAKLTRAKVIAAIPRDIEGEGMLEYLMFYPGDGWRGHVVQTPTSHYTQSLQSLQPHADSHPPVKRLSCRKIALITWKKRRQHV